MFLLNREGQMDPASEIRARLDELEEFANASESVKQKAYTSFSIFSYLAYKASEENFRTGWAADLLDTQGDPLLTKEEAIAAEALSKSILKPILYGTLAVEPPPRAYEAVRAYYKSLSQQTNALGRILGPHRLSSELNKGKKLTLKIKETIINLPNPERGLSFFLHCFIDSLRVLLSHVQMSQEDLVTVYSLITGLLDFLRGSWKRAIPKIFQVATVKSWVPNLILQSYLDTMHIAAPEAFYTLDRLPAKLYTQAMYSWIFLSFAPDYIYRLIEPQITGSSQDSKSQLQKIPAFLLFLRIKEDT